MLEVFRFLVSRTAEAVRIKKTGPETTGPGTSAKHRPASMISRAEARPGVAARLQVPAAAERRPTG